MNTVDILKYGQLTVHNTLKGFPEAEWYTAGACGVWSVKEIIAHLASYEQMLVEVLLTFLDGGPTPYMEKMGTLGGGGSMTTKSPCVKRSLWLTCWRN